jgi:hypothetical protein
MKESAELTQYYEQRVIGQYERAMEDLDVLRDGLQEWRVRYGQLKAESLIVQRVSYKLARISWRLEQMIKAGDQ